MPYSVAHVSHYQLPAGTLGRPCGSHFC